MGRRRASCVVIVLLACASAAGLSHADAAPSSQRDSSRAAAAAARDSARVARAAHRPAYHGWGGLMTDPRAPRPRAPKMPRAAYLPHTLWTDRPLSAMGTHTARPNDGEYQIGIWSYARSHRTVVRGFRLTGSSGDTLVSERARYRIESTQVFGERLVLGLSSNVDVALLGTLYERYRVSDLDHGVSDTWSGRPEVYTALLKVRVHGADTTSWSRAVGVSFTYVPGGTAFGIECTQVFPFASRWSCRANLEVDATTGGSGAVSGALGVVRPWGRDVWAFAEYSGAWLFDTNDPLGAIGAGLAIAAGVHFMFDGGVRIGVTDQTADSQYFLGFSFR